MQCLGFTVISVSALMETRHFLFLKNLKVQFVFSVFKWNGTNGGKFSVLYRI